MKRPVRILLQTTIPTVEDDWAINRFSLLSNYLDSLRDESGSSLYHVTARDRQPNGDGVDPVLGNLHTSDFDELWLFAVDTGDGLNPQECEAITKFYENGGGLLTTRDHDDLGSSLCTLGGVGSAHHFHTHNPEPDPSRRVIDDPYTPTISWPNYHSGANGDHQAIKPVGMHELLRNPGAGSGIIEFLPAHPHEGAVGVPTGYEHGQVVATGRSKVTGNQFNLVVAFDHAENDSGTRNGRGVADSSFHHFVDYNWDPRLGAPSFVSEPPGESILKDPRALGDTRAYVRNLALWLAPERA